MKLTERDILEAVLNETISLDEAKFLYTETLFHDIEDDGRLDKWSRLRIGMVIQAINGIRATPFIPAGTKGTVKGSHMDMGSNRTVYDVQFEQGGMYDIPQDWLKSFKLVQK